MPPATGQSAYKELSIIKGLEVIPGAPNTLEDAPVVLNLLDVGGFSVMENGGWMMAYPQTKSNAVYLDSPFEDGGDLVAAADARVKETIKLTATAAIPNNRAYLFHQLGQMRRWARQYHTTDYQTEPVYLKLFAFGAPGPQYALIYDINVAPDKNEVLPDNVTTVTITIEREVGWRWHVPPGQTPKLWTLYANGITPSPSNITLKDVTGQLFSSSAVAAMTIAKNTAGQYWYQSFIDIPASAIPGDLPALVELWIDDHFSGGSTHQNPITILVARNSKSIHASQSNTLAVKSLAAIPYTTSGPLTDASYETDHGVMDTGQSTTPDFASGNNNRIKVAFSTLTYSIRTSWTLPSKDYHGTFAVFGRCLQSGGAQDDVRMYLSYGLAGYSPIATPEVSPTLQAVVTDTEYWPLTYFGVIQLPVDDAAISQNPEAAGLSDSSFLINLNAKRITATGTPTLYIADLVLMPIEDGQCMFSLEDAASFLGAGYNPDWLYLDSTGYLSRGRSTVVGESVGSGGAVSYVAAISGEPLTLIPGVNNRLYFLFTSNAPSAAVTLGRSSLVVDAAVLGTRGVNVIAISGNIVPRSIGVRDQ